MTWTRIPARWTRTPPSSPSASSSSRRTAACAGRATSGTRSSAGEPSDEPLGWLETVHSLDRAGAASASGRLAQGEEVGVDHRAALPDGSVRWLHTRARFVDGRVVGWSRDLTADRAAATELDVLRTVAEKHSRKDPLTGVSTRRYLHERLAAELARADRDGATPGLVLLELQGLRSINERLGHVAGDTVLATVAARLANVLRRYDTVGRWDGARFAVVAPNVTSQGALNAVAGKLQASIEREPVDVEGVAVPVFATVGCARAVGRGHPPEVVIAAAENALDEARAAGPGGVRLAPDNPSVVDAAGGEAVRLARALALAAASREGVPEAHAADVADLSARLARSLELAPRAGADLPPGGLAPRRRHRRRAGLRARPRRRAERERVGRAAAARRRGRARRAPRRRPGARRDDRAPPPRALGRHRLPGSPGRRGHPAGGPHRGDGGRVRLDDRAAPAPPRAGPRGRARRAAPRRRQPARPAGGRRAARPRRAPRARAA